MKRLRKLAGFPFRLVGDYFYEVALGLEAVNDLICGEED